MDKQVQIIKYIKEMEIEDKLALWNKYCVESGNTADKVYFMDDLEQFCVDDGMSFCDVAWCAHYGRDFDPYRSFVWLSSGHLADDDGFASGDSLDDAKCPYDPAKIAFYIDWTGNTLGDANIQAIMGTKRKK